MRTGRPRGTLLSRLERLESRAKAVQGVKVRFGEIRRLPEDYKGERHVVVAKHLPNQSGQEWVEFEERPARIQTRRASMVCPKYIDVVFV